MLQTHLSTVPTQRSGALFSLKISPNTMVNPYVINDHYANYTRAFDAFTALKKSGAATHKLDAAKKTYEQLYDIFLNAQPLRIPIEPLNPPGKAIVKINAGLQSYFKKHFGGSLPKHLQGKPVILNETSAETSFHIKPSQKEERNALLTSFAVLTKPKLWPSNMLSAYKLQGSMALDTCGEKISASLHSAGLNPKIFKYLNGIEELKMATAKAIQPNEKGGEAIEALLRKDA